MQVTSPKDAWNVEESHQEFLQRLLVLSPTMARFDIQKASRAWAKLEQNERAWEEKKRGVIPAA